MIDGAGPAGTIDAGWLDLIHRLIHAWVPHSSALLDGLSVTIGIVSGVAVMLQGALNKRDQKMDRAVRVGLAATPIPVFLIMPLIPYDKDLAQVLTDERTILALAAGTGLVWTVREVWKAFKAP